MYVVIYVCAVLPVENVIFAATVFINIFATNKNKK